ncbi:MAG: DNA-methyltransferase [Fastidiosipilaceae bacterium]|jgi:site-specific DNA-methyltransferase (adenine-specific)
MKDLPINQIIHGDCLEVMKELPEKSVDMILCDLPYGITACAWDVIIPFEPLWEQYERVIKDNGAIVLFSSQPFTSLLVMSNPKMFKYEWIWEKDAGSNFVTVKYQPMKEHENILVFGKNKLNYYPIMQERIGGRKGKETTTINSGGKDSVYGTREGIGKLKVNKLRNPRSIQRFNRERGLHPTQKPVKLMEYLINTYTKENEVILDNCIGSGTTAIACINTGRNFIGIEKEEKYVRIAQKRIEACKKQNQMRLFPLSKLEKTSKRYKGLFE